MAISVFPASYSKNYSKTPVLTGEKWIDGKDIYKIVVTGNLTGYDTKVTYASGFTVDTVISFENYVEYASGSTVNSANCFTGGDKASNVVVTAVDRTKVIISSLENLWSGLGFHCIIKFTMS